MPIWFYSILLHVLWLFLYYRENCFIPCIKLILGILQMFMQCKYIYIPVLYLSTDHASSGVCTSICCCVAALIMIRTNIFVFSLSRFHSTVKPMRSSSVLNPTTTTSALSSCWTSPCWAPTPSLWRPRWWTRVASSGRRGPGPRCRSNLWRIRTLSSSAISCSRVLLSLLHRGVHTLASSQYPQCFTVNNRLSLCTWPCRNWVCTYSFSTIKRSDLIFMLHFVCNPFKLMLSGC